MASAPARIAAWMPAASVTPQIFTKGSRSATAGSSGNAPAVTNDRAAAAGSAARMRASPTRAPSKPTARQPATVAGSWTPDSAIASRSPGTPACEPDGPLRVDVQRPQVAVVEPDDAGTGREGTVELARVVGLDERLEPEVERGVDETREPARRMEHREEEDRVGAGRPEERELARVDDELLGQDGDGHRGADGRQVGHRATEPVRLAQDARSRRAPPRW